MLQCHNDLTDINPSLVLSEPLLRLLLDDLLKVATWTVLQHQEEVAPSLEALLHSDDEWVVSGLLKDGLL